MALAALAGQAGREQGCEFPEDPAFSSPHVKDKQSDAN